MDRGAWRAAVHRVAQSQTQLKQLSTHTCMRDLSVCVYTKMSLLQGLGLWFGGWVSRLCKAIVSALDAGT